MVEVESRQEFFIRLRNNGETYQVYLRVRGNRVRLYFDIIFITYIK